MLVAAGCGSTEVEHPPPQIVGERMNAQGQVIQRIITDQSFTITTHPSPEGPHRQVDSKNIRYFLEEKDKPRRELSPAHSELACCESYLPVSGSDLWVGAYLNINAYHLPPKNPESLYFELNVVVFDTQQFVAHQKFDATFDKSPTDAFRLENGNRTLIIRSPNRLKKYDVIAGRLTDAEPGTEPPK
ncbi:MAG TPA: hypothetical protein VGY55_21295 [Pirellulales bacterium]|jgi:hypothetical protein|nr:hypothetical protein [Pirellulales bacterium]